MKRAALHNLGCKVNAYETEAMQQLLEEAGYEIVPFQEAADVYIVNTCSVTNIADRKSRQMLHRAKKTNPNAAVVAVGCYVQAAAEELKLDESVDLIVGNNKKTELVPILEAYFAGQDTAEPVIEIGKTNEYETLAVKKTSGHTRAFIKVQDGCNQFCSYCIIPYTRGRVRSRRIGDVLLEVEELVSNGYREVVLTGIHLSSYGTDFHEQPETLLSLIKAIHRVEGLERIRLGSLEPRIVTEAFAQELAGLEKICPHFHLSLQSGCDRVLKRMNRRYTAKEYEHCCNILRSRFQNPAITTDVIVGFPGETQEEFEESRLFLEKIRFYEMHVFKYSKRAGTKAADMPDQVPEPVKTARSEQLLSLGKQMSAEYRRLFLDTRQRVLLEEEVFIGQNRYMAGYTKEYVRVAIPWEPERKNTVADGVLTGLLSDEVLLMQENIV